MIAVNRWRLSIGGHPSGVNNFRTAYTCTLSERVCFSSSEAITKPFLTCHFHNSAPPRFYLFYRSISVLLMRILPCFSAGTLHYTPSAYCSFCSPFWNFHFGSPFFQAGYAFKQLAFVHDQVGLFKPTGGKFLLFAGVGFNYSLPGNIQGMFSRGGA